MTKINNFSLCLFILIKSLQQEANLLYVKTLVGLYTVD